MSAIMYVCIYMFCIESCWYFVCTWVYCFQTGLKRQQAAEGQSQKAIGAGHGKSSIAHTAENNSFVLFPPPFLCFSQLQHCYWWRERKPPQNLLPGAAPAGSSEFLFKLQRKPACSYGFSLSGLSSYTYTHTHALTPFSSIATTYTTPHYFHHILLNIPFHQSPTLSRIHFHKGLSSETISLVSPTSPNTRSQESPLSAHTSLLNVISISLMKAFLLLFL